MSLSVAHSIASLQKQVGAWKAKGLTCAIVPTMGALHEGHLRLVEQGLEVADRVLATIFINPKQFAAHEDLGRYPRDEEADLAKLGAAGTNLVFMPTPEIMYPPGFVSTVQLEGPAKAGLEDKFRPQFFDGVATIVAKLFICSGADFAMFGEKDYQQLKVVSRMAADLNISIKVMGVATEREADGLAMSSRNRYLTKAERNQATAIYKNLMQAAEKIRRGVKPQSATRAAARSLTTLGFKVDYVTARNAESLAVPQDTGEPLRLIAAAWLGKTRLIDNIAV
jgi:pantoate--beta-alanine ligase